MNLSRAKRRWSKWRRWQNQVVSLCGSHHKALPGEIEAHHERAFYLTTRGWGYPVARRFNRLNATGWRR